MMDFISSLEFHVPIFNPAIKATPRAVVSVVLATLIVLSKISAWNCIRKEFFVCPPSTLIGRFEFELVMDAWRTSLIWKAVDSNAALIKWYLVVVLLIPVIIPSAFVFQWGEPNPLNAGTKYNPPLSFVSSEIKFVSETSLINLIPSLIHCIADPVEKTEPSDA